MTGVALEFVPIVQAIDCCLCASSTVAGKLASRKNDRPP